MSIFGIIFPIEWANVITVIMTESNNTLRSFLGEFWKRGNCFWTIKLNKECGSFRQSTRHDEISIGLDMLLKDMTRLEQFDDFTLMFLSFLKSRVAIQSNIFTLWRKCNLLGVFKFNLDFNELINNSYIYPTLGTYT